MLSYHSLDVSQRIWPIVFENVATSPSPALILESQRWDSVQRLISCSSGKVHIDHGYKSAKPVFLAQGE